MKACYVSLNLEAFRPYNKVDFSTYSEYQKNPCIIIFVK